MFKNNYFGNIYLYLDKYRQAILTILSLLIIAETFLIKDNSDLQIFLVLGLYVGCAFFFKLKSNFTLFISLVTLGCMYVQFIISNSSSGTEKAAVLLFFFMFIGIIQQIRER